MSIAATVFFISLGIVLLASLGRFIFGRIRRGVQAAADAAKGIMDECKEANSLGGAIGWMGSALLSGGLIVTGGILSGVGWLLGDTQEAHDAAEVAYNRHQKRLGFLGFLGVGTAVIQTIAAAVSLVSGTISILQVTHIISM